MSSVSSSSVSLQICCKPPPLSSSFSSSLKPPTLAASTYVIATPMHRIHGPRMCACGVMKLADILIDFKKIILGLYLSPHFNSSIRHTHACINAHTLALLHPRMIMNNATITSDWVLNADVLWYLETPEYIVPQASISKT